MSLVRRISLYIRFILVTADKLFPAWMKESTLLLSIRPEPVSMKLGIGA